MTSLPVQENFQLFILFSFMHMCVLKFVNNNNTTPQRSPYKLKIDEKYKNELILTIK